MQAKRTRDVCWWHAPACLAACIFVSAMLASSMILAGPPDCKEKPDHPSCDGITMPDVSAGFYYNFNPPEVCDPDPGGNPGCEPMEDASSYNGPYPNNIGEIHHPFAPPYEWDTWDLNTLGDIPRPCEGSVVGEGGMYGCLNPEAYGGRVTFLQELGLKSWQWAVNDFLDDGNWGLPRKNQYLDFCRLLNDLDDVHLQYGPAWYVFNWGRQPEQCIGGICYTGCTEDYCSVKIVNNARIHPFMDLAAFSTYGEYDLPAETSVQVRAFVDLAHEFIDFPVEGIPFTVPQNLPVERLQIAFGHNNRYAVCETTYTDNIWFVTRPIE